MWEVDCNCFNLKDESYSKSDINESFSKGEGRLENYSKLLHFCKLHGNDDSRSDAEFVESVQTLFPIVSPVFN